MNIPRSEYPRPQFVRRQWMCLNGPWQFEIDRGDSGLERGLLGRELTGSITVPFCPESPLSGVGDTDFLNAVWYRRTASIPPSWRGQDILLHFQACDYDTTVWVNGVEVQRHRGGFTPFTCELRGLTKDEIVIVVRARDNHRQDKPVGKQANRYNNYGCHYVRTTGIWQTVWMEPVPAARMGRPRITPDLGNRCFHVATPVSGPLAGHTLRAVLRDGADEIARAEVRADGGMASHLTLPIPADRLRLWDVGDGQLYDIDLELRGPDGAAVDHASTYAGMRSVTLQGRKVLLNGRAVFQRQVLDQGFYPDGILTAPSDQALRADIELAMAAGFNSARLHQKVFEERFLYHADRLGYLVWGEFGDWGCHGMARHSDSGDSTVVAQWTEALLRDYSHPSIVGWCPVNESHGQPTDQISILMDLTRAMFLATKAMDPTRPVLDASGYTHLVREADIYDSHNYTQDVATFAQEMQGLAQGKPFVNTHNQIASLPYAGQPYFCSEFGGIWWNPAVREGEASWGYGQRPASIEEFYARFEGLCNVLLDDPEMFGYCYTQLTDVFQEQNGVYTFDRKTKFDMSRIRAIQTRPAAYETRP